MFDLTAKQAAVLFGACLIVGCICAYGGYRAAEARTQQALQRVRELEELLSNPSRLPNPAPSVTPNTTP